MENYKVLLIKNQISNFPTHFLFFMKKNLLFIFLYHKKDLINLLLNLINLFIICFSM